MPKVSESSADIRFRAIQAVKKGGSVSQIAKQYQVHRVTLYKWMKKYGNSRGVSGCSSKPRTGRPPIATSKEIKALCKFICMPASKFGFHSDTWNTTRILQVAKKELDLKLSKTTVWKALRVDLLSWSILPTTSSPTKP